MDVINIILPLYFRFIWEFWWHYYNYHKFSLWYNYCYFTVIFWGILTPKFLTFLQLLYLPTIINQTLDQALALVLTQRTFTTIVSLGEQEVIFHAHQVSKIPYTGNRVSWISSPSDFNWLHLALRPGPSYTTLLSRHVFYPETHKSPPPKIS